MALFLMLVNAIPTVIGTAEALDVQKKEDLAQKHKAKFFMTANFALDGKAAHEKEAQVVLRDNRVCYHEILCAYIDTIVNIDGKY